MNQPVVIKGNKSGLIVHLDDKMEFPELKEKVEEKFASSSDFLGAAQIALSFEGRKLSEEQKYELMECVREHSKLDIVCLIDDDEKKEAPYREIVLVQDNSSMEFLPDLKLNDSTGKTIADRAEESLDKVFTAAAAGKSFSTIKNEFSADTAVQKTAKEQYQQLCDAYLNSDTNTGITSITVSSVSTTVTNESNQMKIETNVTAAIERRTRFLHFFRKTKIETVTWKLESVVTLENEKWVMGSDFLTKIGHEA